MNRIYDAINNPRICAILLLVESPGGMVANIDLAANLVKNCPKPLYSYVSLMSASSAMWFVSGSKKIIASSPMDAFGSIGTKAKLFNIDGILKKFGADIRDIYATKSTHKDFAIRELLDNNNEDPIRKDLDFINEIFHKTIQENMGISKSSDVFTADLYYAEEAINKKLCHEILSIEETIDSLHKEGLKHVIKSYV